MRENLEKRKRIMRRAARIMVSILIIIAVIIVLGTFEIKSISNVFLRTLWSNFNSISTIIYVLIPLIILLILVLLFLTNKWALRVEKMSIGGFNIIFDNPAKLYKRQVRNYLDTKRTVFKIDCNYDNFYETLDSFFEVYKFFRDEAKMLASERKQNSKFSRNKESANLYLLTNQAIQILNDFLTKNQSDYRRWYKYIERNDEEAFYLTPIGELQRKYPHYEKLCFGFKQVNIFFSEALAKEFDIDILKWDTVPPTSTEITETHNIALITKP